MKFDSIRLGAAIGAGVLVTVLALPQAKGDVVYESETAPTAPIQVSPAVRVDARETQRQALGSAEKAQTTIQAQAAPAVQVVVPAPTAPAAAAAPAAEVENLSKTELMRRERIRTEMKNEDILQERLEELRLRDEKKRTDQVLGQQAAADLSAAPAAVKSAPLEDVVITPGAAVQPAPAAAAPVAVVPAPANPMLTQTTAPVVTDRVSTSQAAAVSETSNPDRALIGVTARAGVSEMTGGTYYSISPRYSGGVGLTISPTDVLDVEIGYTYSEYGVAMASTNPYINQIQQISQQYGYQANASTVVMKQNLIDAGLKLHILGPEARFRPFIGGGAAYGKSYINYDSSILNIINQIPGYQSLAQDYELNSFLGYVSTGFDVRLAKNVTLGATFKYYTVLSASENQSLNNAALYGYSPYGYNPYPYSQPYYANASTDKQLVGGSVSNQGFYTILAGATFTF
jgi:outer membrane protein W